jgi:chaperonin GroEL (HSP60 family)
MTQEQAEHLRVLKTNITAVQALVEAVAGTLGPQGLDILLVDDTGRMILTNDGIEILRQTDFQHPAARLAVEALKAQEQKVGDGTTTATILAGALLAQALKALEEGVSVNLLLRGIQRGIGTAISHLQATARPAQAEQLYQVALVAARGDHQLASMVGQAAHHLGLERLRSGEFRLADWVLSRVGADPQLIPGVVVGKPPLNAPLSDWQAQGEVLVLADGLEAEVLDPQTLATEAGFGRYLEAQARFTQAFQLLPSLGVKVVVTEKSIDPSAADFLFERDILVLQRVITRDRERICQLSGAKPIKATLLHRSAADVTPALGTAQIDYRKSTAQVIFTEGRGMAQATLLVGALSEEVAAEQERIAVDACGALQAAVRSGVVTGGGLAEWSCRPALQQLIDQTEDLSRYGMACVYSALGKPLEQLIRNSGYPTLEKLALVEAAQKKSRNSHLGLDCETGQVADLALLGILDPCEVKVYALTVAADIALRILRIQTLIRRREES